MSRGHQGFPYNHRPAKNEHVSLLGYTLNQIYEMMKHTLRCLMLGGYQDVFAGYEKTLKENDLGHLETGLAGTYMAIQYLQKIGRDDLIYLFASKKTFPSWGYMIANGAKWEHWNGRESQIHNYFNSIGSWFIQGLAGIRPDESRPGFKNAIIKPAFIKKLEYVEGSHETAYCTIQSGWK